ncbi:hypothetical protein F4804DRAFT_305133 [Jackrogersella minutella]|nr:hypothetical protein F4804DRAFT_305133 [Jackrogersella minutella]
METEVETPRFKATCGSRSNELLRIWPDSSAELVLAAAVASSTHDGFLRNRPGSFKGHASIRLNSKGNNSKEESMKSDYCVISEHVHKAKQPSDDRAWAYQEKLLARRYLSYGGNEMGWQCCEDILCKCGWAITEQPDSDRWRDSLIIC